MNALEEKVRPAHLHAGQDVTITSTSVDDISFASSPRNIWYQRYCAIPDNIATEEDLKREQELMSIEALKYASEKERASRSKWTPGYDGQVSNRRKRRRMLSENLDAVSATLQPPDGGAQESTSSQNPVAGTSLGLQDVQAFDFFDDDDYSDENDSQDDDTDGSDSAIDDSGEENIASGGNHDSDNDSDARESISDRIIKDTYQNDSDIGAESDNNESGDSSGSDDGNDDGDDDDDENEGIEDENDDNADEADDSGDEDGSGFDRSAPHGMSSKLTIFNV